MTSKQEKYASFLVRIWEEPRERRNEVPEWRGSVEHVQTGQKRYFIDADTLVHFIGEVVGDWNGTRSRRRYIA